MKIKTSLLILWMSLTTNAVGAFLERGPDRLAGAVAIAPLVRGFEFNASMTACIEAIGRAALEGREPFLDAMFGDDYFIPSPLDRSARTFARSVMAENFDKQSTIDMSLPIAFDPPLIERLADIEIPVLLVAGELDHVEVARRNAFLREMISQSTEVIVQSAGHNPHLENPGELLQKISPFLAEHTRSTPPQGMQNVQSHALKPGPIRN